MRSSIISQSFSNRTNRLLRGAFIEKPGFEKDEAAKQGDGDAHHVEADIAERAVAAGNVQLVKFI